MKTQKSTRNKMIMGIMLMLLAPFSLFAQIYNDGATLTIESGLDVYVEDDFVNQNSGAIDNSGVVHFEGDFTNNGRDEVGTTSLVGPATTVAGEVRFEGSASQQVSGNSVFNEVDIDNSAGVSFSSGTQTVRSKLNLISGQLTTNNVAIVNSDNAGTGYVDDFSSGFTGTLNGDIIMERYVPSPSSGFHDIGVAVNAPNISEWSELSLTGANNGQIVPLPTCDPTTIDPGSPYGKVFEWREAGPFTVPGCDQSGWYVRSSGSLDNGRGYTAIISGGSVVDVQGTPNTGSVSYNTLSNTNSVGDGYHLVANPYPSAIDWTSPAGFDAQAHVWQSSGTYLGTYQSYLSGTGVEIPSSQAFFVRVTSSTSNFTLTNSDRRTSDPSYVRTTQTDWYNQLLTLIVEGNGFGDKTAIYFTDGATNTWDSQHDAHKLESTHNQPTLYTRIAGDAHMIGISGLPRLNHVHSVDMGLMPGTDGNFIIRPENLESFPSTALIMLEDKQTGTITDLRSAGQYSFSSNVLDDSERFVVHFVPPVSLETVIIDCEGDGGEVSVDLWEASIGGQLLEWDELRIEDSEGNLIYQAYGVNGPMNFTNLIAGTYSLELDINSYQVVQEFEVNSMKAVVAAFQPSTIEASVNESIQFTNTSQGAEDFTWDFGDDQISQTSDPTHLYTEPGSYQVKLISMNKDCKDQVSAWIEVSEKMVGISSVTDNEERVEIWMYDDMVNVELFSKDNSKASIELFNPIGQLVYMQEGLTNGHHKIKLDNLADEMLLVKIQRGGQFYSHPLMLISSR